MVSLRGCLVLGGWDYNDGWIMAMDYTYQLAILDYGFGYGWVMAMDWYWLDYTMATMAGLWLWTGIGWIMDMATMAGLWLWTGIGWIIIWLLWLDYGYGLWIILDYTVAKTYNVVKTCLKHSKPPIWE